MDRRDFIKQTGASLTGLILGSNILTGEEARALEVVEHKNKTTSNGVEISCYTPGRIPMQNSNSFDVYNRRGEETDITTSRTKPGVEFAYDGGDYIRVRASAGKDALSLTFPGVSKAGGFQGRHPVTLDLKDGVVQVIRKKGWYAPVITFEDAVGRVVSGTNIISIRERDITNLEENAFTGRYRGSTPLVVRPKGGIFEYHFRPNGGIERMKNPDFKRY